MVNPPTEADATNAGGSLAWVNPQPPSPDKPPDSDKSVQPMSPGDPLGPAMNHDPRDLGESHATGGVGARGGAHAKPIYNAHRSDNGDHRDEGVTQIGVRREPNLGEIKAWTELGGSIPTGTALVRSFQRDCDDR